MAPNRHIARGGRVDVAAVLALLASACPGAGGACDPMAPRPRIYVYSALPAEFRTPSNAWRMPTVFTSRLLRSPYRERDGACADFYYLPHFGGAADRQKTVRMLEYTRRRWPWYNRSVAERPSLPRHILYLPCDHGPGDCNFGRGLSTRDAVLNGLHANPASPARQTLHLVLNGMADHHALGKRGPMAAERWCLTCFARGVDIRLPSPHKHLCGPLCGYSLADLRARSPWAMPRTASEAALRAPRPVHFFWAGSSRRRGDVRSALLAAHVGREGWRVLDLAKQPRGARKPDLSVEMPRADFCASPLGWDGGDSDRYLPAVLFGCIPVFFSSREAKPLEDLAPEIEWSRASVTVEPEQVPRLHEVLGQIAPIERVRMRLAMRPLWRRLLFSSFPVGSISMYRKKGDWAPSLATRNASYLGEDGSVDAFDGVMRVLRARALRHERRRAALAEQA